MAELRRAIARGDDVAAQVWDGRGPNPEIWGPGWRELKPGELKKEGDRFEDMDGFWEKTMLVGTPVISGLRKLYRQEP